MATLRPVCAKCSREMHCEKCGVDVYKLITFPSEIPHEPGDIDYLALGDLYKCPGCGVEIITGFGGLMICGHEGFTQERLKGVLQHDREHGQRVVELKRA